MVKQKYKIKCPIDQVWEALTNSEMIDEWGGGPAKMEPEEDSEFELWGGDIHGVNIEVKPEERLVQEWYSGSWSKPSHVTFDLEEDGDYTIVELSHEDVPEDEVSEISSGWREYFMEPLKEYLEAIE